MREALGEKYSQLGEKEEKNLNRPLFNAQSDHKLARIGCVYAVLFHSLTMLQNTEDVGLEDCPFEHPPQMGADGDIGTSPQRRRT